MTVTLVFVSCCITFATVFPQWTRSRFCFRVKLNRHNIFSKMNVLWGGFIRQRCRPTMLRPIYKWWGKTIRCLCALRLCNGALRLDGSICCLLFYLIIMTVELISITVGRSVKESRCSQMEKIATKQMWYFTAASHLKYWEFKIWQMWLVPFQPLTRWSLLSSSEEAGGSSYRRVGSL